MHNSSLPGQTVQPCGQQDQVGWPVCRAPLYCQPCACCSKGRRTTPDTAFPYTCRNAYQQKLEAMQLVCWTFGVANHACAAAKAKGQHPTPPLLQIHKRIGTGMSSKQALQCCQPYECCSKGRMTTPPLPAYALAHINRCLRQCSRVSVLDLWCCQPCVCCSKGRRPTRDIDFPYTDSSRFA